MAASPAGAFRACRLRENVREQGDSMSQISWQDFEKVDIRLGSVIEAEPFPETRKPSVKLAADFGPEVGVKKTSAQLTEHYSPETLLGRQMVAVVNLLPKRIAGLRARF